MEEKRPVWTSRFTFILAAVGSAVGLGNIWRFPYIMGQNGGAIFLITYLFLIMTICFVPLIAELFLGRLTKKECVGAYEQINPKLSFFGALNPITGVLIASFYFIVGGWIINYIFQSTTGLNVADYSKYFGDFIQSPVLTCTLTLLFLFICIFFTAKGIKKGIEYANKVLMPLFAVILVFLVGSSLTLPNASLGLEYMFKPDFTKLNSHMVLAALGQAFFTLSIGMGALLTYGSYIDEDKKITKSVYTIILSDTLFALLAGVMIFPAVFSFGLQPASGAGLVFVTLPKIFSQLPYGNVISFAFFILLFCAAVTSGISILEAPCATLIEKFKLSRIKACTILFILISLISIPAALSFGKLGNITIIGKSIFEFLDFTTSNILLPLNSLILCLILGWKLKLSGNTFFKNDFLVWIFNVCLRFVVPIVLIGLLYVGLR